MIVAEVRGRDVIFIAGEVSVQPPDRLMSQRFARPALAIVAEDDGEGTITRRRVKVAPGTGQHFRAVLRSYGLDVRIFADDGEA